MDESDDCVLFGEAADGVLKISMFRHSKPPRFDGEESLLHRYRVLGAGIPYNPTFRNRSELLITETELRLIAAAAKIGFSVMWNTG